MELAVVAVTIAAAVTVTIFVAYYWTLRWEDSPTGKSIMAAAVSTALLSWCGVAQRYDEMHSEVDWKEEIRPAIFVAWLVTLVVFLWRIREIRRSKRGKDEE